jgi:hypothetical protein
MFSIIATLIYDCCFGLKRQPEKKSARELIVDLEVMAEEELEKLFSYYSNKRKRNNLACC